MRNTTDITTLKHSALTVFLYRNKLGRVLLKLLSCPCVSKIVGAFMSSPLSKPFIKGFVKNNNIDLSQYEEKKYSSYNDFFTRKIKPEFRPMDEDASAFISPADSRLLALKINKDTQFKIKDGYYSLPQFLGDDKLASEFIGGYLLVFRLCVDDYHRYCFVDDGEILSNYFIPGKLHTVQPIALERDNFFKENCREISVIDTKNLGKIAVVQVGAMMVGKIVNHTNFGKVSRGEEAGYFEFGGSTVCVVLKSDAAQIDEEILKNTQNNLETRVLFKETIGKALRSK